MVATGPEVRVRRLCDSDEAAFVAAARKSARLHEPWVTTPTTEEEFRRYLKTYDGNAAYAYVLEADVLGFESPQLVGYINIRQIEKRAYSRGVLGFATFAPYQRKGYMTAGLNQLVDIAFNDLGLHRLEAEVQPRNKASIGLIRKIRFRYEGYLPALVQIGDERKGHRLWAMDVRRREALGRRVLRRPAPLSRTGEWLSWRARMPEVPITARAMALLRR